MGIFLLRTDEEISNIYTKYVDTVYRIALIILKNVAEAEDATQNVFIKLIKSQNQFDGEEHIKAWLITVTQNTCKDMVKSWWRSKREDLESIKKVPYLSQNVDNDTWEKVMGLHTKYKLPIYLYYYEGYGTEEISRILKINHATVRTQLHTARKKLKLMLEEDDKNE